MGQVIKRGIIQAFNASTYTVSVLLFEATSAFLTGMPVATSVDGTSCLPGALCAVLFFDEQNPQDAVVIATYANGSQGVPSPSPGRMTFSPNFLQVNSDTINAGATNTYTLTGGSSGIPPGALGVAYKAFFTSVTAGTYIQLGPHGTNLAGYDTIGNLPAANGFLNGGGVLQVDASGKIDIKANSGACTVSLYTHGYVI